MDVYTIIKTVFGKVSRAINVFGYNINYMKYVIDSNAHYSNGKVVQKKDNI